MTDDVWGRPPQTSHPTPNRWELVLPWTKPPMSLNDRMDRWTKARWTKTLRQTAWALAKQAKIPPLGRCEVVLLYVPRERRRRDEDNLTATLKPLADGLVDAGVVVDDTPDYMRKDPRIADPDPKQPRLVLIVERRSGPLTPDALGRGGVPRYITSVMGGAS